MKDPKDMTAGEINKALDRLNKEDSELMDQFIDAGRGHETASQILKMDDPLAKKYREIFHRRMGLRNEVERRYGPGAPHRLPKGFGPIKGRNPGGGGMRTKRVDGEDLPASSFLIVGDPNRTVTWHLPVYFSTREKTISHIRDAASRFDQVKGVGRGQKEKARRELDRLEKEFGIGEYRENPVGDGKPWLKMASGRTLKQAQALAEKLKREDRKLRTLGGSGNYQEIEVRPTFEGPGGKEYGVFVVMREENPAVSAKQYGLAQAVLSGRSKAMPKDVAREIVDRTPHGMRSEYARELAQERNPSLPKYHKAYFNSLEAAEVFIRVMEADKHIAILSKPEKEGLKWCVSYAEIGLENNPTLMERIKRFGHKTTIHHIGKGRVMTPSMQMQSAGSLNGHKIYKTGRGEYVVPSLDRESRFEDVKEAKRFIKANPQQVRYLASYLHGYPESEYERVRDLGQYNFSGPATKINKGTPAMVIMKHGKRSLVRADYYGTSYYGWVDSSDLLTEKKFVERFGYEPEKSRHQNSRRNPEDSAADMYESFHGKESDEVIDFEEEEHFHGNLAGLGTLVELQVITVSGYEATLKFPEEEGKMVLLCCNEEGTQLYFMGGDQSLDLKALHMSGEKWERDSMLIGVLCMVTYRTEKKFDKFQLTDYYHKLGEDTGVEPVLIYDCMNQKLSVSGGQYHINQPLIGMSPGIEN